MIIVICEDGESRHEAPFETRQEAAEFANWGHCCTNRHRIVTTDGVELGITTTESHAALAGFLRSTHGAPR